MIYGVIPARAGSKGLPGKNRMLFQKTASKIPDGFADVIVSTDDVEIMHYANEYGFTIRVRDSNLSSDFADTRQVLRDVALNMHEDDIICLLYLTYPERTPDDILNAIETMYRTQARSLMCKKPVDTHPYLALYELPDGRGMQVVNHDLYRRQDYPPCFELSHFVFCCYVGELQYLNRNLYNSRTVFMPIEKKYDIDTESELREYEESLNNVNG